MRGRVDRVRTRVRPVDVDIDVRSERSTANRARQCEARAARGPPAKTVSSSGGDPASCVELCDLEPVDGTTASCVAQFITLQGYDASDPLCDSETTNTPSGCLGCYNAIDVTDGDCVNAHSACF